MEGQATNGYWKVIDVDGSLSTGAMYQVCVLVLLVMSCLKHERAIDFCQITQKQPEQKP